MLKKIFDPILRFFTVIASALTGITALCTAVGFLAHRGHLKMLGRQQDSGGPEPVHVHRGDSFLRTCPLN
ncbi:MAG: hypothetical protein U5K69_28570 [Balneolaceae bacterium]|nr:hypothetical protein [Balneolaceae bacterium]